MNKFLIFLSFLLLNSFSICNSQELNADVNNLSTPNLSWGLSIDLSDFEIIKNNYNLKSEARNILVSDKTGFTVSVFIEKSNQDGDSKVCRDYYWSKGKLSPLKKDNIQMYERGEIALLEYLVKEYKEKTINMQNISAYLSYDGYWIDVHISKVNYSPGDKIMFDKIINSIKIKNPKERNFSELFIFAVQFYHNQKYNEAIKVYEDILSTEQSKISIDKILWTVIVDNLAMAYGATGNIEKCKSTLEYGIKFTPLYSNFYYNMACAYAEDSDIIKAVELLEKAYSLKDNVLPGESINNPKEDPSFKNYLEDKNFKEFLKKHNL